MDICVVFEKTSKNQVTTYLPRCAFLTEQEGRAWVQEECEKRFVANNKTYEFGSQNISFFIRFFQYEIVPWLSNDLPHINPASVETKELSESEKLDAIMEELKEAAKEWKPQITASYIGDMQPGYFLQPSELELKIRKDVMEALGKLEAELFKMQTVENVKYMETIKDRLNLLWGE